MTQQTWCPSFNASDSFVPSRWQDVLADAADHQRRLEDLEVGAGLC